MTEASDWTGAVGDVWAAEWRRTDRSFAALARALDDAILAAAPPADQPSVRVERRREAATGADDRLSTNGQGRRVLDIGCGAGATSIALARARPDLAITGVDLSAGLLAVARERAGDLGNAAERAHDFLARDRGSMLQSDVDRSPGIPLLREGERDLAAASASFDNLTFIEGDVIAAAGRLAPVDLFVSRHGVMFFDDPVRAFAALHAAASPSAALVFSCFRSPAQNAWMSEVVEAVTGAPIASRDDAPGPFAFADEARVAAILADAGWISVTATPIDYTYIAGQGADPVADAVSFFSRIGPSAPILRSLLAEQRDATLARLAEVCARHRHGDTIDFPAAAWIWSARA